MSYYLEPGSYIRYKIMILKKIEHVPGVDTSNLTAKKGFIALKAEVDKLGINKLVNVPTSLNNLKIKVDDLDVGQSRTVPIDMKKVK